MNRKEANDKPIKIGLALSGGGSRAIAFHLGCMRELHRRGLLEKVTTISTVSGGSIIGALWAYTDDDFNTFDEKIQSILRDGLVKGIVVYTFLSSAFAQFVFSYMRFVIFILNPLYRLIALLGSRESRQMIFTFEFLRYISPRRFTSESTAFANYLNEKHFSRMILSEVKRKNLQVIINATDLSTLSLFQFGSKDSGSPLFGELMEEEHVGVAVAASASFPIFLPTLNKTYRFRDEEKNIVERRMILTDGGIYDNSGVHSILLDSNSIRGTGSSDINFIIACSAETGKSSEASIFWRLLSHLKAYMHMFTRRNTTTIFDLLHGMKSNGEICGFLMPYLGQDDSNLHHNSDDFVSREEVCNYPTDFFPMNDSKITRIAKRGEQQIKILIDTHYPNLAKQ